MIGIGMPIGIIFIALAIGVVLITIFSSIAKERKHQEGCETFARRHKLRYSKTSSSDLAKAIFKSQVGKRGRSQRMSNILEGEFRGKKICIADFSYVSGTGKRRKTHRQTVLITPAPAGVPEFELRPENVLHKIGQAFGYQDIDFRDYPVFSKQYLLRGKDETAVRKAFGKTLISRLEQVKCLSMEACNGHIFVWHDNRRQKAINLENFTNLSLALATSLKTD